jgi:hypothetical protein
MTSTSVDGHPMVRLGRPTDLPILRDIERAAGEPFRAAGMAAVADDEPPDLAEQWGSKRGSPPLILTTYAEVPWNAPYYRRLGFSDNQIGPALRAMRDHEKTLGLDAWPRVAMSRPIPPPTSA